MTNGAPASASTPRPAVRALAEASASTIIDGVAARGAHPTAVVDRSAEIHPEAFVGPYCVIGPGVRIGRGAALHSHVVVHRDVSVGEGAVVFPFAVLGADPQDLKYHGERTRLEIGARTVIREHVTIHRGTGVGGGLTTVGEACLLMVGAHVAHDCVIEDEAIIANSVMLGGHCVVQRGATVAGGAGIHHFATVGSYAFVGGLTRITKDVPPFLVVEGNPAEPRKVNTTALQRRAWPAEDLDALRAAYKALYRGDEPMTAAIERLRAAEPQRQCVLDLCLALERSAAGVHGRWLETRRESARNG